MKKIAIFGVGLMGGSLALCFKGRPGLRVVGHDISEKLIDKCISRNIVDQGTTSFESAAADADFIFLCVPVGVIGDYLLRLSRLPLKPGCVITDVGSTKSSICRYAAGLDFKEAVFIGGHPMAGSERSGVEAASSHLYENAFYVLTPAVDVEESDYGRLEQLLLSYTRAQIVRIDPEKHDAIVGAVSHLPHIIAAGLVNFISRHNEVDPLYRLLAAGGFRDITRIASSELVWWDILLDNREVMLGLLGEWEEEMQLFRDLLLAGDRPSLERLFLNARAFRSRLPERRKGMISSLFDIYVDVPDHPGVIGHIAGLLGSEKINLSNIQIMESRDEEPGVLRLSFRNEQDMDRAVQLLKTIYEVRMQE